MYQLQTNDIVHPFAYILICVQKFCYLKTTSDHGVNMFVWCKQWHGVIVLTE